MLRLQKCLRFVSAETLLEAESRGLLHVNGDSWRFGDQGNGATRSLNPHSKFKRCDNKWPNWHRLIGLDDLIENKRSFVIFVLEGSKDALASLELAHRAGLLQQVGVVVALSAAYRPIPTELEKLRGKTILLVGDRDPAGMETTQRVSEALTATGVDHAVLNWNSFSRRDGKDVFELLNANENQNRVFFTEFFSFFPSLFQFFVSYSSVNRPSYSSVQEQKTLICPFVCPEQFVLPYICTGSGQRFRKLFELARACKKIERDRSEKLSNSERSEILEAWWTLSQQHIKRDKNECLLTFIDLVTCKIHFVPDTPIFEQAAERARRLPLPDFGINSPALQKIAALMRELQRAYPDLPFFCSVETARAFAELPSKGEAHRCLRALEQLSVIECVKRGVPGKPRATRWRYKLEIPERR